MQTPTIAAAISSFSGLLTAPEPTFEGLATLHGVREQINELFETYASELRADPSVEPMWNAIAAAMSTPSAASIPSASKSCHELRVEAFWGEHVEQFTWDFVPMEVVHEIYSDWMRRRHTDEAVLTKAVFSKRLRKALPECGAWRYTRARTGVIMRVYEPLAQEVSWRPTARTQRSTGFVATRHDTLRRTPPSQMPGAGRLARGRNADARRPE